LEYYKQFDKEDFAASGTDMNSWKKFISKSAKRSLCKPGIGWKA
jgi:hypothetical protein